MSHELRTPLNAVIGFSELLSDQPFGPIGATYVEYATEINMAGHHLLDMINDVLDLSKIEAGRYDLAQILVELAWWCDPARHAAAAGDRGRCADREPAGRESPRVRGDARALKQIVLNLLSNAVKFTPQGGVASLHIEHSAKALARVVTDTGIGIDAAALESLGQPFQQADASIGRHFGGSGLGLAISRKLLTLHGGALTIESEPGHGTTVRAMLPPSGLSKPRQRCEELHPSPRYLPDACDERASRSHGVGGKREQPWQLRWTRDERNGHSPQSRRSRRARRGQRAQPEARHVPPDRKSRAVRRTARLERRQRAPPRRSPDRPP